MINRQKGSFAIECDACGDTDESHADDFNEAWQEFWRAGWQATKSDDIWTHQCPGCSANWRKKRGDFKQRRK